MLLVWYVLQRTRYLNTNESQVFLLTESTAALRSIEAWVMSSYHAANRRPYIYKNLVPWGISKAAKPHPT